MCCTGSAQTDLCIGACNDIHGGGSCWRLHRQQVHQPHTAAAVPLSITCLRLNVRLRMTLEALTTFVVQSGHHDRCSPPIVRCERLCSGPLRRHLCSKEGRQLTLFRVCICIFCNAYWSFCLFPLHVSSASFPFYVPLCMRAGPPWY